jgi:hypothetical protein
MQIAVKKPSWLFLRGAMVKFETLTIPARGTAVCKLIPILPGDDAEQSATRFSDFPFGGFAALSVDLAVHKSLHLPYLRQNDMSTANSPSAEVWGSHCYSKTRPF